jgi:hypothetical protein
MSILCILDFYGLIYDNISFLDIYETKHASKNHPLNAVDEQGGKIPSKTGTIQSRVLGTKVGKFAQH